jgi:hypothetical protein
LVIDPKNLSWQAGDSRDAATGVDCGRQPCRRVTFEDGQREYGISGDDIRAALKFAGELVEQEEHHPLPA